MPFVLLMIGIACATYGALLGGNSTKVGGALLLLSIAFFSASVGWSLRDSLKGDGDEKDDRKTA